MTAPAAPARSRRTAVLLMFLVVLGGGIAGIAIDRLVLLPWHFSGRMGPGRGAPEGMERRGRDRFARELGLSDSQRVRIDSLLERQMTELRAVRGEVQPRLDSILAQTRRSIDSILTPEQREKAQQLMRRREGRGPMEFRDGAGRPGPEGPGAPGPRDGGPGRP
ncbi:MAG: hypothetical protein U0133_07130 [Gemmatimonadales bacterium]